MNPKIKTLLLIVAIAVSLINPIITKAEVNTTVANTLIERAFEEKTFYAYNMAYGEILKISDSTVQVKLLEELGQLEPIVWTSDVRNYVKMLEQLTNTGSGKIYDNIQATINSTSLLDIDKGYLLGELTGWGRKLVFTADYTKAIDSLKVAWNTKASADISSAESTINAVVNSYSKSYLQEELQKLKSSITGNSSLVKTSTGKYLIYDKEWTEKLNKNEVDVYTKDSNIESKVDAVIKSAINISQGRDVENEIKTPWVRVKYDNIKYTGVSVYIDVKYRVDEMDNPSDYVLSDYIDQRTPKATNYLFRYIVVYKYSDCSKYEVHQVYMGL